MIKMSEIAKKADVSVATVSLALNNKKGVSDDTRKKIIKIADDLGYVISEKQNEDEKRLNIQLIVAFSDKILNENYRTQPFFSSLIDILLNYSNSDCISFSFSSINSKDLVSEINNITNNSYYDGIIILSTNLTDNAVQKCIERSRKPIVFLDSIHKTAEANTVGINNWHGVHLAVKHLIESGHKNFGYVESDIRIKNFEERKLAFKEYVNNHNGNFDESNTIKISPNMMESQDNCINKSNLKLNGPTAFFCENDAIAISFIKSINNLGYSVPDDISVIGFDNIRESTVVSPELTTVSVDQNELVKVAIEKLIHSIENPNNFNHTYINCSLLERESVKKIN